MGINVLSLFDGMSCGQQALERTGIEVYNYFASEIDKYAIQVTMANYPDTKQLGSVVNVDGYSLPKIDLLIGGSPCQSFSFAGKRKGMSTKCETEILTLDHYLELKNDGFEFEGQSYLFWEYMRLLNETKPTYFLLENVEMGEKWEKVLSKAIGVNGIHINSSLVSAQNRKRIYWTNIGMQPGGLFGDLVSIIDKPKDKGILLKDILETDVADKYFLSETAVNGIMKHKAEQKEKGYGFGAIIKNGEEKMNALKIEGSGVDDLIVHNTMPRSSTSGKGGTGHLSRNDGKTYCLDTGNTNAIEIQCVAMRGRNPENPKSRVAGLPTEQQLEPRNDGKTNCLTSVQKDNLLLLNERQKANFKNGDEKANTFLSTSWKGSQANGMTLVRQLNPSIESVGKQPYQQNRVYDANGISPVLCANKSDLLIKTLNENQQKKFNPNINSDKANALTLAQGRAGSSDEYMDSVSKIANITSRIRRLTPKECMRLQTVNDNYLMPVSDSQKYKMLGNGWTVDVVAYIFSYLDKF
jgi:DNA (cytosine-5)-methyltransferase 3A